MGVFSHVQTVVGGSLDDVSTVVRLDVAEGFSGPELAVTNYGQGLSLTFDLDGGTATQRGAEQYFSTGSAEFEPVAIGNQDHAIRHSDLARLADSAGTGLSFYANGSGFQGDLLQGIRVDLGGREYVYLAKTNGTGISIHEVSPSGDLRLLNRVADTGDPLRQVCAMTSVAAGDKTYLIAASEVDGGLASYEIGPDGSLRLAGMIEKPGGVSYLSTQTLQPVSYGGKEFVIRASADGILSVLEVRSDGIFEPISQVRDSLSTRFDDVTALKVFEVDGRVFVLASGSDDGISLLTLLPDGRLLHLESIADQIDTALSNISDIAVAKIGPDIHFFVTSGAEAGLSQFKLNVGPLGIVAMASGAILNGTVKADVLTAHGDGAEISAGAGDDILIDGAGIDRFFGGAGADVFVFKADGTNDYIKDFEIGKDRIDLSSFSGVYSVHALDFQSTDTGVTISIGGEALHITTLSGAPLTEADFYDNDVVNIDRVPPSQVAVSYRGYFYGTADDDTLKGGDGGAEIHGYDGRDELFGGNESDALRGGGGSDRLHGGLHNDWLYGGDGLDFIWGGIGHDRLFGGDGNDRLFGQNGHDRIYGGRNEDLMIGDAGHDMMDGGPGHDTMRGGFGMDALHGGWHNDWLYGGPDMDLLRGDGGHDRLFGGDGNDLLHGGSGHDRLFGARNEDLLVGGNGDDVMFGGAGHDELRGGNGNDTMTGDWHNDTFIFVDDFGQDTITDFDANNDLERIDLSAVAAITDHEDLMENHIRQVGEDVVIDDLLGNTITLSNVFLGALGSEDFLF